MVSDKSAAKVKYFFYIYREKNECDILGHSMIL